MFTLLLKHLPNMKRDGGNERPGHYMQRHRLFQEAKNEWTWVLKEALEGATVKFEAPVQLTIVINWKVNRRRDPDNVAKACKPLFDALVSVGILPDDSAEVIGAPTYVDTVAPSCPCTILQLEGRYSYNDA